jgi:hypothetical protein
LVTLVPPGWEPAVVVVIKGVHTAIFASMSAALAVLVWDGIRQRPGRRTVVAGGLVMVEAALFVSNDQVCPLTPLAEEVGATSGSVADIFLPDWMARRIPLVGGTALVVGTLLSASSWLRHRGADARC